MLVQLNGRDHPLYALLHLKAVASINPCIISEYLTILSNGGQIPVHKVKDGSEMQRGSIIQ